MLALARRGGADVSVGRMMVLGLWVAPAVVGATTAALIATLALAR